MKKYIQYLVKNNNGSVLIMTIITIVVMSALGAGISELFSTSIYQSISSSFSSRAYYTAESGYRYAVYKYIDSNESVDELKNIVDNGNYTLSGGSKFFIDIDSFWLCADGNQVDVSNFRVKTPIKLPDKYTQGTDGFLHIDGTKIIGGSILFKDTIYNYSAINWINNSTLEFNITSGTITASDGDEVYIACEFTYSGNLKTGDSVLNIDSNPLKTFVPLNGSFSLITNSGNTYDLLYEKADFSNNKLTNIKNLPGSNTIPSSGVILTGTSHVVLKKNIELTSTATSGEGSLSATKNIKYYQPLYIGFLAKIHKFSDSFANLDNWNSKAGGHSIATVDGNTALKVDSTKTAGAHQNQATGTYITADYEGRQITESMIEVNKAAAGFLPFYDIWDNSDQLLSYDLQVKVKFTETEDKDALNPLGTYMPGLVFRVRNPDNEYPTLNTYYGLSFMRAITGIDSGIDIDDIPDDHLFSDPPENKKISEDAANRMCPPPPAYVAPPPWNGIPPVSGVPYIILWQKALDYEAYVKIFGLISWEKNEELYVDWLSYIPLCDTQTISLYHYKAYTTLIGNNHYPEGWYENKTSNSDPRNNWPLYNTKREKYSNVIKLSDKYSILKTTAKTLPSGDTVNILGTQEENNLIRNAATAAVDYSGDFAGDVAYVFPEESSTFQKDHNYRIYLKPWVTIMARIVEAKGDFFNEGYKDGVACGESGIERVNVISAWFTDPDLYPRGSEIKWPSDTASNFYDVIWHDNTYNSKMDEFTDDDVINNWSFFQKLFGANKLKQRLCERGEDEYPSDERRSPFVKSSWLTTEDYDKTDYYAAEVGLHTFGIDSSAGNNNETLYFDDFGLKVYEFGNALGLIPGVQTE